MRDQCSDIRRKARGIVEIRYPATPRIFDLRGAFIEKIHPEIQSKFPHWRVEQGSVLFTDSLEMPVQEFLISLKRSAVGLEDFSSIQEFIDRAKKYYRLMWEHIGGSINHITRCGVRLIEVMDVKGARNYEDVVKAIKDKFVQTPVDVPLEIEDFGFEIIHSRGKFKVGPARVNEAWTNNVFRNTPENIPEYGLGLDIDSYISDITVSNSSELEEVITTVFKLTKALEESLVNYQGALNE